MYILAGVVADPAATPRFCADLSALLPSGKERLHWRDENDELQARVVATIGSFDLSAIVVIGTDYNFRKQERARRKCMDRLFFELEQLAISRVILEARTQSLNSKDRRMIVGLRGGERLKGIRVDFGYPTQDPMLWIADAVAGAVGAARKGRRTAPSRALRSIVTEIEFPLS